MLFKCGVFDFEAIPLVNMDGLWGITERRGVYGRKTSLCECLKKKQVKLSGIFGRVFVPPSCVCMESHSPYLTPAQQTTRKTVCQSATHSQLLQMEISLFEFFAPPRAEERLCSLLLYKPNPISLFLFFSSFLTRRCYIPYIPPFSSFLIHIISVYVSSSYASQNPQQLAVAGGALFLARMHRSTHTP